MLMWFAGPLWETQKSTPTLRSALRRGSVLPGQTFVLVSTFGGTPPPSKSTLALRSPLSRAPEQTLVLVSTFEVPIQVLRTSPRVIRTPRGVPKTWPQEVQRTWSLGGRRILLRREHPSPNPKLTEHGQNVSRDGPTSRSHARGHHVMRYGA